MQNPTHDPGSALAIRTQYRQSQSRAARLRLLVDAGQELTQLAPEAMRQRVLQRACAFLAMDHALLLEWDVDAQVRTTASQGSRDRLHSLDRLADTAMHTPQWQEHPSAFLPNVLRVPLRGGDGAAFGALVLANSVSISAPDSEDIESLQLLATLLAAHLENHRLLDALVARERTMSDLVHRLFRAQEDERKRMAYDLHDGLAQTLAGLHQRLSGFNVFPNEIEAFVAGCPGVEESACIGVPNERTGEAVKLFVVRTPGNLLTADDVKSHCRGGMTAYKVPKIVVFMDHLPKSTVGKVLRRELRDLG
jgi:GAF domain-containing protein